MGSGWCKKEYQSWETRSSEETAFTAAANLADSTEETESTAAEGKQPTCSRLVLHYYTRTGKRLLPVLKGNSSLPFPFLAGGGMGRIEE